MVPGEQKYTEKDVLDPSVLCGSQPASWVSATVSWLLCVVAYWSHPWWHVEFSILHMPELVSFMARLVMDEFQRSSIRVPAVMTALGKGAVNCSKPCSGLVKSCCGAGSERHTRLSLVMIRIMLKLFMSLPLGACSSCTVLWMLLPKKPLKEESPKHFCFIHCCEKNCWLLHLMLLQATLCQMNTYLKIPDSIRTGSLEPFTDVSWKNCLERNWKSRQSSILHCYRNLQRFHSSLCVLLILHLLFLLGHCHSFLLLPDPVCMTQMSCLPANCISWDSQSRKEIPNTNWRLAILSLVLVHIRGRMCKVLHWLKYSCIPPAHLLCPSRDV